MAVNELICTDLIVDDQIKEVFRIYYSNGGNPFPDYFAVRLVSSVSYPHTYDRVVDRNKLMKWNYLYVMQKRRVVEAGVPPHSLIFHKLLQDVIDMLPERYKPSAGRAEKIEVSGFKGWYHTLVFKEQVISYLMQAYRPSTLLIDEYHYGKRTFVTLGMMINFFRSLCERTEGLEFDEYIKRWAKRLMEEHR